MSNFRWDSAAHSVTQETFDKVERAKREWEATADSLSELICLLDDAGQIIRGNRAVERWGLGKVQDIQGQPFHVLLHPSCAGPACELAAQLKRAAEQTLLDESQEWEVYDELLQRFLFIRVRPVPEQRNVTARTSVIVVQDITERKRVEQELRNALAAKDEMIQNVSHELRTPLTIIQGYAGLLREQLLGDLSEEQIEAVQAIDSHSRRLHNMVEKLLTLQALSEEHMANQQLLDLVKLIQVTATNWQMRFQSSGISLQLDIAPGPLCVVADSELMTQVLYNLLDNALRFSAPGSDVTIRAYPGGSDHVMVVADQGIGIPPAKLENIFDRFYQVSRGLNRSYGGMGIGLALCRRIVDLHRGRIWAESCGEGQGSAFYVALPAWGSQPALYDRYGEGALECQD
jgi:PAS domain S-box-containing protein